MEQPNIEVKNGSERSFGLTFAVVFLILGIYDPFDSLIWRITFLSLSSMLLVLGLLFSSVLRAPNQIWFRFGLFLGSIVAPIVMGLVFISVVLPTGLLMQIFRADPTRRKFDKEASSYWLVREDPAIDMRNQF